MNKKIILEGRKPLLAYDTIFKAILMENFDIVYKMVFDFTKFKVEKEMIMPGYETVPMTNRAKIYRSDVLVKVSEYVYVLVEMNYRKDKTAKERNIIQLARISAQVVKSGEKDEDLSKYHFILINFNNFEMEGETSEGYDSYILQNGKGVVLTEIYKIYNVSLAKCRERVYNEDIRKLQKR